MGYATELSMYPLDFEEFCWAMGVSQDALGHVAEAYASKVPVNAIAQALTAKGYPLYAGVKEKTAALRAERRHDTGPAHRHPA